MEPKRKQKQRQAEDDVKNIGGEKTEGKGKNCKEVKQMAENRVPWRAFVATSSLGLKEINQIRIF